MSRPLPVEVVLRWRLARAAANAPPAPRASHLLELARPPWELWPARWRATVERLRQVQVVYGHAMTAADRRAGGYPVPVVVAGAGADGDVEGFAQVRYLSVVEGQLRLRFALDVAVTAAEAALEVLFVAEDGGDGPASDAPVLVANATRSVEREYRLAAELPSELARTWAQLRVTDPMPFRLVLRPIDDGIARPA
jgi:hypothetical protein